MASKTATPWGAASVIEEISLPQKVGGKRFSSVLQLLELDGGEPLLRFAYTTDGATRRGPVTVRVRDLAKVRRSLARRPALSEALGVVAESEA